VINRCGVLTGPWQMGKVDQGFVVLWAARHLFGRPLSYIGYGGTGRQVRDMLHVADLCDLLLLQIAQFDRCNGLIFNVGGGNGGSVSLCELTALVQAATGRTTRIDAQAESRVGDIPYYVSDCSRVEQHLQWQPRRRPGQIVEEIVRWIGDHRSALEPILS
jgi:CDP-paratose 2-epimerase